MKRILILSRKDDREHYDQQHNMVSALRDSGRNSEYVGANFEELVFTYDGSDLRVTDSVSETDVADYDAIFLIGWFKTKSLDDVARAVAHYAHARGVAFANGEAYHGRSFTKLSQCVIAALNGVTVTPFIFAHDHQVLLDAVKKQTLALPYIAKAVAASRGQDNHLIKAHEQLERAVTMPSEKPLQFIVQQFVPNEGDYRILVMGGQVQKVIHRRAQAGSHLNNTSQGGTATLVDPATLPPKVIADSIKLSQLFRREVTGVDMIRSLEDGQFYFLEANNMPQLATGSNVAEKINSLAVYLDELASGNSLRYID